SVSVCVYAGGEHESAVSAGSNHALSPAAAGDSAALLFLFHTDEVKTIVQSSRDAVNMMKGKVAEMMQNERAALDALDEEFSKTWQYKSSSAAVYSIQGRRDHMEDRFDILTDALNKSHPTIFGIFDGHGGEVNICLSLGLCMHLSLCLLTLGFCKR
ncbi:hypothetical protein M9458_029403, partial [Cirrhinus mrigala]